VLPILDEIWEFGRKHFGATAGARHGKLTQHEGLLKMFRSAAPSTARYADRPGDYAKLGIQPERIESFEDGMRTQGGPGGYEWWYFDSHLSDGSSLVIIFFTKEIINPGGKLAPLVTVSLDRPGQPTLFLEQRAPPIHSRRAGTNAMSGSATTPFVAICMSTRSISHMAT